MNTSSIRLPEEFKEFSKNLQRNRTKKDMDEKTIGHPRICKLIVKFFKANNYAYLELVKMEEKNNA